MSMRVHHTGNNTKYPRKIPAIIYEDRLTVVTKKELANSA